MKKHLVNVLISLYLLIIATACTNENRKNNVSSGNEQTSSAISSLTSSHFSGEPSSSNMTLAVSSETGATSVANASVPTTASSSTASSAAPRITVNVIIPEGYSVSQIGDVLANKGVCTKSDFLTQVNTYPFTESVIGKIPSSSNRCFKLEGYLFPNTYTFYTNMKAQDAIGKILRSSDDNIDGKNSDETVIIASIIQMECAKSDDMKNVSSVIHNRLKSKMKLQLDSTINYIERYVKPIISGDINRYNSYYNTYKCSALPEGPICNPGKQALDAAAAPNSTNYLYFVTDNSGKYIFSATYIDPKSVS